MASKYKTQHLGLNSWVLEDIPDMEDFNADNSKLDAAVAGKADASQVYTKVQSDNLFARAFEGSASGNPAVISDLQQGGSLRGLRLLGATTQQTQQAGKNLFHHTMQLPTTINGVTVSYDAQTGEYILNGTVQSMWTRTVLAHLPFAWKNSQLYAISVEKTGGSVSAAGEKDMVIVAEAYHEGAQLAERFFADTQLVGGASSGSQTYTSPEGLEGQADELYIFFDPWFCEGNTYTDYRLRFQLEEGEPTAWEPYQSAMPAPDNPAAFSGVGKNGSVTITAQAGALCNDVQVSLQTPLYRLPDGTCDQADLIQGRITRYAAFAECSGDEGETWTLESSDDWFALFSFALNDLPLPAGSDASPADALSNRFRTLESRAEGFAVYAGTQGGILRVQIETRRLNGWQEQLSAAEKVACFTNWLTQNPLQLLYRRAQPLEQSGPYLTPEVYSPQTTLSASEEQAMLQADYLRDTGMAFAALEARVAALEATG